MSSTCESGNGSSPKKRIRVFSSRKHLITGMDTEAGVNLVRQLRDQASKGVIRLSEGQYETALWLSGGFLSYTAKMLNRTAAAVTLRIQRSPRLQEVLEEIKSASVDLGEAQLVRAVKDGEPWAIRFLLSHLGRDRGYFTRQEVTGKLDHVHTGGVLLLPAPAANMGSWERLANQWEQKRLTAPDDAMDADYEETED